MNEYVEHRYLTDDRDLEQLPELVIRFAPNGDFYIGSCIEGDGMIHGVRICNSGGASSRNPELRDAVRSVFMALGGWHKSKDDGQK